MSIMVLVALILIFCLLFWLIQTLVTAQPIKNGLLIALVIVSCLVLLSMVGLIPGVITVN